MPVFILIIEGFQARSTGLALGTRLVIMAVYWSFFSSRLNSYCTFERILTSLPWITPCLLGTPPLYWFRQCDRVTRPD
jgi:hypothetical protein